MAERSDDGATTAVTETASAERRGFSLWRPVVLGVILIPPNAYWVEQMEMIRYSAHPTTVSLFFNAVFGLLLLVAANHLLRRFAPRLALTQPELLLTYSMLCIGSAVAGHDMIQVLMPYFSYSFRLATPANKWDELFNDQLPTWLTVRDEWLLDGFYEGGRTFYDPRVVAAWLGPGLLWSLFIVLLLAVMMGINVVIRRQWLEGEHLACPLVNLPVEISEPRGMLFRSHAFWIGFALAATLDTYNSFAFLYPTLPKIPIEHQNMAQHFGGRPWNAVGWFPISFYPFVVGMGYLMPSDFLFSCWFFYLFWKAERVFSAVMGWDQIRDFPFDNFQCFGAYALFGLYALWISRGHLSAVFRRFWSAREDDSRREPASYRLAFAFIGVGFIGLVWFSAAMKMQLWIAALFFVIYYGLAVAVTRMRAQFGAPVHDLHFTGPGTILTAVIGTRNLPRHDLIGFALYYWFNRAYRSHPMPHQMEAFKMQDRAGASGRAVVPGLMIAGIVGTVAGLWCFLHMYYDLGAHAKGRMFGGEAFNQLAVWLQAPQGPRWGPIIAIGVGLAQAFFLQTMRMRFVNWPFHPLGFAISANWEMNLVWLPLLIAWVIKTVVVKYGGHRLYQRLIPAFIGIIIGQFVVGSILNIVSIALKVPSYMFWQ